MTKVRNAGRKFTRLVKILEALRVPGGCPWDRAQDERSIRDFFLEEVFEAVEAIETGDADNLAEELGDVLMEIVFLSRIYEEKGFFTISDALDRINRKMVLRHPHVFGRKRTMTPEKVVDVWQKRKLAEKEQTSILQDPGPATPSLLAALFIGQRVSAFGFDWPTASEALAKVREETGELEEALAKGSRRKAAEELGDLFFALVNVSRKLRLNPEVVLRRANRKFVLRFRALERKLKASGKNLRETGLREMDKIWDEIKTRKKK